jgi:hypothetical protein
VSWLFTVDVRSGPSAARSSDQLSAPLTGSAEGTDGFTYLGGKKGARNERH